MHKLEQITDRIRKTFDARTSARDQALAQARQLTRACSLAIRAVHREEADVITHIYRKHVNWRIRCAPLWHRTLIFFTPDTHRMP